MKLEDEIKQRRFSDEYQKLSINLIFTHNWLRDRRRKFFENYGLTPQQYNVLRILRGNHPNPYSTSEIRDRMIDKMSDASRIVDRLHKKTLVVRNVCKKDKRLVDVVISDKGLSLLNEMDADLKKMEGLLHSLDEKEAKKLNKLLDKLRSSSVIF